MTTDVTDLTTKTIDGSGVFDCLMSATRKHLQEEYDQHRIRGPEYSQVYLANIQSVLGQSIQYISTASQTELTRKQVEVAEQQRLKGIQDVLLSEVQVNLIREQVNQTVKQTELICQQIISAQKQNTKIDKEIEVLEQKRVTELAQTDGVQIKEGSVLWHQTQLYAQQAAGYYRDALQKAVNKFVDTWNVRRTTDNGTTANAQNKLQDAVIGRVVCEQLANLGISNNDLDLHIALTNLEGAQAALDALNASGTATTTEIALAQGVVQNANDELVRVEARIAATTP